MSTPCKPQFHYIKVGCKGVFITQTGFHDVSLYTVIRPRGHSRQVCAKSVSIRQLNNETVDKNEKGDREG